VLPQTAAAAAESRAGRCHPLRRRRAQASGQARPGARLVRADVLDLDLGALPGQEIGRTNRERSRGIIGPAFAQILRGAYSEAAVIEFHGAYTGSLSGFHWAQYSAPAGTAWPRARQGSQRGARVTRTVR
jgi:hypothetical protein